MESPQPNLNHGNIRLNSKGVWLHDDIEITHERTVQDLFRRVSFENGQYFLKGEQSPVPVAVDDVAFFVRSVQKGSEGYVLSLSDDTSEILDPSTLDSGSQNQMYCQIKDGLVRAKFERKAYNDLMQDLQEKEGYLGLEIQGIFYPLKNKIEQPTPPPVEEAAPAEPKYKPVAVREYKPPMPETAEAPVKKPVVKPAAKAKKSKKPVKPAVKKLPVKKAAIKKVAKKVVAKKPAKKVAAKKAGKKAAPKKSVAKKSVKKAVAKGKVVKKPARKPARKKNFLKSTKKKGSLKGLKRLLKRSAGKKKAKGRR